MSQSMNRRQSFMSNVKNLRDEQERVQKKTFTNWINTYLIQCQPPCKITDLFPEVKDGIRLLQLLEVLSGQKLPHESRKPMQRVHCLSNVRTALSFLESKKIKLVNINPADIVDGKPSIVLGLIWTIILYFQIEEQEDTIMKSLEGTELAERGEKFKGSAKKALLAWAQNNLGDKYSIDIRDFGNSWRDGAAFNAMVHNIDPSLVDMAKLASRTNRENLEAAFAAAENGLNIPRLIDPEDVDVDKPDEKSIMTYVAQFLKAYPEGSKKKPKLLEQIEDAQLKVEAAKQAAENERNDLREIADFCQAVERELPSAGSRGDPAENYKKFEDFLQQQKALTEPYETLLKRRADGHLLTLKPQEVDDLEAQWRAASDRLSQWRWQLDSALPGDLGKVGSWLASAERCLREPFPNLAAGLPDEEVAEALHQRLLEHNAIFAEAPAMRRAFQEARKSTGRGLPAEQLADIDRRLTQVQQDEPEVRHKLEYLESKYRILTYFIVTERKLPEWTGNFGHLQDVEALLGDYDTFVVVGKLLPSVDQALESFRQCAEVLKKRDSGKSAPETRESDRFATEATRKWDRLKREVQAAPEPLKRVAESWREFMGNAEAIESWLPSAQAALRGSADERESFFANFADWEARHKRLNDSGGLLIANCTQPVAEEVRQRLQRINRQWKDLQDGHRQTERMDAAERNRREYHAGTSALTEWLDRAEQLVEAELPCNSRSIRDNLAGLQATQEQQEPMENEFKTVSKNATSMVKELPEQTVNEMLGNLKVIKERFQNLRKKVPERSRGLKGVLPNVENLENGLEELVNWIETGERLLKEHGADADERSIEQKIEAHKTHFGQANYFKSVLDGKNRFLEKIKSARVSNLNTSDLEDEFKDLNRRFKELLSRAEQEAQDMQAAQSSLRLAKDWLRAAGDRLEPLTSTEAGDKASLASRLDRLNDLINSEEEGAARIKAAMEAVRRAMAGASPAQRAKLQAELDDLQRAWDAHRERAQQAKADLEDTLDRLGRAEALESDLASRLAEMEGRGREASGAKNSLEEKRDQVEKLQQLLDDLQAIEPDFSSLDSSSQSQLQSRLRSLAKATEAAAEKAAAAAADHDAYQQELEQLTADIDELEDEARDLDSAGTAGDLEAKQRLAEELAQRRGELYGKLQALNAAAEKVCAASGSPGRDRVRGEVRGLKNRLDGLVDQLTTRRKQLEQSANQWRGLGEQLDQISSWLQDKQSQLDNCTQLRNTLEEKKEQLLDARGLHNEVAAFGKRLQSAEDRLRGLSGQGLAGSPDQERQLEEIKFAHENLLAASKDAAAEADEAVRDHAEFKEVCTDAGNWISGLGERLAVCSDLTGDRQALQTRLDRLDDLSRTQTEGEQRLDKLDSLADAVCRRTGNSGVDAVRAEASDLRVEWTDFVDSVEQAKRDLADCADRWAEYEDAQKLCSEHVRTAEAHLKAAEPRPTLDEKSALADRLSDAAAWANDVAERDFSGRLHDAAADLAKASREGHVTGQAASLTGRFALLRDQLTDQAALWRAHADEHAQLDRDMADVDDWLADFEDRLGRCGDGRGDRFEVQARLATLGELNAEREDGFRRLAALQDKMQASVLPATSGAGRDRLRQAAQRLQDRWDACLGDLGRSRQQLDSALAQWTLYEEGADQVDRWLRDYRAQLEGEPADGSAQSLAEKRAQAERLRNLQSALRGHQPAVRGLADKAAAMLESQEPSEATEGVQKMVQEFEALDAEVAARLRDADRRLRDHQQFKEVAAEAAEWLEAARDRLAPDGVADGQQLRTDRQSLEARAQLLRDTVDGRPVGEEKLRRVEERAKLAAEGSNPAGRRQIEDEVAALNKAMKDLMAECQAQSGQVSGLNKRWSEFDAQLDALNAWLADREARVRHEPGVDLDDKRRLAAAQESLEAEISDKQADLEALSELSSDLLQDSGVDLRVSTQLAKTGARYHALEALAREHAQKLRSHADDHAEFERNAVEAERWISAAAERLAAAERDSGEADKYELQRQLDRVNDLSLTKEEGQVLLQAAGHWADKTEQNTAQQGRPAIRNRLAELQRRWDTFTRELLDARAAVDRRQMQWAEHDDTVDRVQRWLADQSSRLREQPLPADLAEKRAAVQRARETQQAVTAYRPVLESAAAGCRRLGRPADQLLADYDALVQLAADAATAADSVQERHQRYQQAAADTNAWLRQRRDHLASLSSSSLTSTMPDAETASRDLSSARAAKAELEGEGDERMRRLRQLADDAMEATSAPGQSRLRQEVAAANADLDDLRQLAADSVGRLERFGDAWRDLGERSAAFTAWLNDLEAQLRSGESAIDAVDDTADAKRRRAEEAQRRNATAASPERLAELEAIADRAQSLGCSQRAQQLAARHQAACRTAADAARKSAAKWQAHADLDAGLSDLEQWLAAAGDRLGAAGGDLERLAELQTQLEAGRGRLRAASELADRVLPDTARAGQEQIRARLASLRDSFDRATGAAAEARTRADAAAGAAKECRRACDQLEAWLTDAEARASTAGALVPTAASTKSAKISGDSEQQQLEEKKAALERLRALSKEVDGKSSAFARLAERAAEVGAAAAGSGVTAGVEAQQARELADSLCRRYSRLQANLAGRVSELESAVSGQEEFALAAQRAAAWLAQAQTRLGRSADPTGGRADLEARLELAAALRTEANREGQSLVDKAAAAGDYLARHRPSTAAADTVNQLRRELATLLAGVDDAEARLGRGVEQWRAFGDGCQRFADWLQDAETRLRRGPEPSVSLETKQRQARDFQVIQEEINNRKADLDKLQILGEQLEKTTRSPQISTRLLQLSSKYQTLLAQCTDLLEEANQKLQQVTKDTKLFEDARDDAKQWIEQATQRLLGCSNFSDDPRRLAEKKRTVKDIADSMLDGENKLAAMLEAGERVLRSTDNPDRVRRQMDEIRQDWSTLRKQLQQVQAGVEKSAAKWSDFQDVSQRLNSWLNETERSLGQLSNPRADLGERRAMQDRLRSLKNEVDRCEPDLEDLQLLCDELLSVGKQPEVEAETKSLKSRYYQLRKAVNAKSEELNKAQKEHQTYHDSLQESEKWILQTSFRLMEQNSAQCPSLEEAQRQLDQHNVVCREIEDHQRSIENVRRMGRRLVEENSGNYELRTEIEGQLSGLDESYANLKETAEQIRARLTDNQQRWKAYRDVLNSADRYLHTDLVAWWSGREPLNVRSSEEARQQTEEARAVQSRLTQLRSDIVNAALKCDCTSPSVVGTSAAAAVAASARRRYSGGSGSFFDGTGGTNRRSPSPLLAGPTTASMSATGGPSETTRLAEKVSRDLQANLDRIDRRLAELSFRRDGLERVDSEADEVADWLRDKEAEAASLQDASALERLRDEVASRSFSSALFEARPELRAQRDALLKRLDAALNQRRQAQAAEAEYRRRQAALDSEVDSVMKRVDNRQTASAQTLDQVDYMRLMDQQTQTPCHQQTQTPKQSNTPSTSALDLTDGRLYGSGHGYPGHHHHHHHPALPSSLDLRNSGGGVGISKKLWPYTAQRDDDPLLSLQRTLTDLEAREEAAVQTPKHRRTQTSSIPTPPPPAPVTNGKPMRGVALLHIIDTVKDLQDELAARRSREDNHIPASLSPASAGAESIRRPAERPLGLSEDNRPVGSLRARSLPRQRPTASALAPTTSAAPASQASKPRTRSPSPPRRRSAAATPQPQQPPPPTMPQPLIGGIENRYGLSPEKFERFIPTRPHWRSEEPRLLLATNGHSEPPPPPPPPQPQAPTDTRRFVRDYQQMLMEPGNQKQPAPRQQEQQLSDSLGRAARTARDMREASNRLRKSAAV